MTWKFERSSVRWLRRALQDAKTEFALLPEHRQETLEREFQEAAGEALRHAQYSRPS